MNQTPNPVMKYDRVRSQIDQCATPAKAKEWIDKADAMARWLKNQGETRKADRFEAERIMWRAKDRLGAILKQMEKAKGSSGPGRGKAGAKSGPAFNNAPTLTSMGISKKLSSEAQRVAALPRKLKDEALASDNPSKTMKAHLTAHYAPARHADQVKQMMAQGANTAAQSEAIGVGTRRINLIQREIKAAEKAVAEAQPQIDAKALSMTAQEKLAAAKRQQQKEQDAEFEARVQAGIEKRLEEKVLPYYREKLAHYQAVIKARKGIMTSATFKLIWTCLHADSRNSVSDKKLNEAFNAFEAMKLLLLNERQEPSNMVSFDDLMKTRAANKQAAV